MYKDFATDVPCTFQFANTTEWFVGTVTIGHAYRNGKINGTRMHKAQLTSYGPLPAETPEKLLLKVAEPFVHRYSTPGSLAFTGGMTATFELDLPK